MLGVSIDLALNIRCYSEFLRPMLFHKGEVGS